MKEIPALLESWRRLCSAGGEAVLATVVKVEGSSYRSPGARMLIDSNGGYIGTISGGCLERHVVQRAWWLTTRSPAVVCRYDTGADEDAQWAFGLGCNGVVHVLLERLSPGRSNTQLEALRCAHDALRPAATAVVIDSHRCAIDVGQRLVVFPDGRRDGHLGNATLTERVAYELATLAREGRSANYILPFDGGEVELFLEGIAPPPRLVVFGAGHDAVPVVHFAKQLGWHVSVADSRAHFARPERFPEADEVRVTTTDDPLVGLSLTGECAVVVMTHSVDQDRELLRRLLSNPPRYVGQLGPRSRTERLLGEIGAIGAAKWDHFAEALHYPIGLDIGADNPEDIALAIVGEIRAVLGNRSGAMLRHRRGTIHVRQGDDSTIAGVTTGARAVAGVGTSGRVPCDHVVM